MKCRYYQFVFRFFFLFLVLVFLRSHSFYAQRAPATLTKSVCAFSWKAQLKTLYARVRLGGRGQSAPARSLGAVRIPGAAKMLSRVPPNVVPPGSRVQHTVHCLIVFACTNRCRESSVGQPLCIRPLLRRSGGSCTCVSRQNLGARYTVFVCACVPACVYCSWAWSRGD